MAASPARDLVPVTILTGFLGAGKTTLLNRILHEHHGEKIAVIENEFGETGVDNEILVKDEEEQIVEMNNGCLCCTVRGDLVRILGDLGKKRRAGELSFDRVIIETTGLANPGPVAQTFFMDEAIHDQYLLDAVVTVVDAKHAHRQLDEHDEARAQVGFADRILLSKTDLVAEGEVDALAERLRDMNPRAHQRKVHFGEADLREILKRDPKNVQAMNALGYTLADRTERYDEAHRLIEGALALSPNDFYILDSMGWVLYRMGRLPEAVSYLEKARALRNDPEVAAHLGEVLWVMGRQQDAREVWNSALELHPQDEKILDAIKRLTP